MNNIYFLDACAVIALLDEEPEVATMKAMIKQAKNGEISLYINAVNEIEIRYGYLRDKPEIFPAIWEKYQTFPINCINIIDDNIIKEAARLKVRYKVSLGDCIGFATAIAYGGIFVTKDKHDFTDIDNAEPGIVKWLK
jgi:predicted nucleic acid-binding protein